MVSRGSIYAYVNIRNLSSSQTLSTKISARFSVISQLIQKFEDLSGITVVKEAQSHVIESEARFLSAQQLRRERQQSLLSIQDRLKSLSAELEKIPRTDDRYLKLVTEEHAVIKEEKTLCDELQNLEIKEREQFSLLSSALRDSHEKERTQTERTKYWSIAGSCIGALIGIIGTSINNQRRIGHLKELIKSGQLQLMDQMSEKLDTVSDCMKQIGDDLVDSRKDALKLGTGMGENDRRDLQDAEALKIIDSKYDEQLRKLEAYITVSILVGAASTASFSPFMVYF